MIKIRKFILIFLFIIGFYIVVQINNSYSSLEKALKSLENSNYEVEKIIDSVVIHNEATTFYLNNLNNLCNVVYKKRLFGWKIVTKERLLNLESIQPNNITHTKSLIKNIKMNDLNRILYGVTNSPNADFIMINEQKPVFKSFEIKSKHYILWYIIGDSELDNANITSKSK